jgi:hypothetical protein
MRPTLLALPLAAALLAGPLLASGALAQAIPVEQVRDCLCREQQVKSLREEVAEKRAAYDAAHSRLEALQRDIDNTRRTMDPNDNIQVQLLVEQIQQRDLLRTQIQQNEYPALQDPLGRLNAAVNEYNQLCAGRPMRKIDIEAARANLQCPAY